MYNTVNSSVGVKVKVMLLDVAQRGIFARESLLILHREGDEVLIV
jgi:hypothetical protein